MPETFTSSISVIAELERIGWATEPAGDGSSVKCRCPGHDDQQPSCAVYLESRTFKCFAAGCGVSGDIITFLALALKQNRAVIIEDLKTRYSVDDDKTIGADVVERYHGEIWSPAATALRKELHDRGLIEQDFRDYRIGYDKNRVTIPVPNDNGLYVNVRRYLPGAPSQDKMKNTRGHGSVRLFPINQLLFDTVIVLGGECKAIVTARIMNPHGIGAVCVTSSEGAWLPEFSRRFRGKRVFVGMDIDDGGRNAAGKICARLRSEARWVGDVVLPLDPDKYPTGDWNDWFGREHRTDEDTLRLLDSVREWAPPSLVPDEPDTGEAERVTLGDSVLAAKTGRRVSFEGTVTQMADTPYIVPKTVRVGCNRNAPGCPECPVFATQPDEHGFVQLTIGRESPALLDMVSNKRKALREPIREGLKIPRCKVAEFHPVDHYNVQEVRLTPQLNVATREADHVLQTAYYVGNDLDLNVAYEFQGRCYPSPRDQAAVLLLSESTPAVDALESFAPSEAELEELSLFQPAEWTIEGLQHKLDDLYLDMSVNVTRIYQRPEIHLAVDLVYHSVLVFNFDAQMVNGWASCLVAGDSAQGKSQICDRLRAHYGLGEKAEMENATVPGVLGGLVQSGTKWFVTWGTIVVNDGRLVVLEELSGASYEFIAKLRDVRSSGVAQMDKVERRRALARTRVIGLSNPRGGRKRVADYNFGVELIKDLVGSPQDIRRFDFCMIVAASQVDQTQLNVMKADRPQVQHRHTADLCRRLILWAWTRDPDQVIFTEGARKAIMAGAIALTDKYSDAVPIVDKGSMSDKLCRLAIGLACRTYSCGNKDPQLVIVRTCHVDYVVQFLDRTYSDPVFGYSDFSEAINIADDLQDTDGIKSRIFQTPFPADFVDSMLYQNNIELRDICDWCGWDKPEALQLLSYMVRKRAIMKEDRGYRKTAKFINFLKTLRASEELKAMDRPSHIPDGKF
jgi:hypothetical protein